MEKTKERLTAKAKDRMNEAFSFESTGHQKTQDQVEKEETHVDKAEGEVDSEG